MVYTNSIGFLLVVTRRVLHLQVLNDIYHFDDHSTRGLRSFCNTRESCSVVIDLYNRQSSAKRHTLVLLSRLSVISLIYNKNIRGPMLNIFG